MGDSKVGKVLNFLSTTVGIFWKMGTYICYEMPKRTLTLYIRVQKTVLYMPFKYVTRLYAFVCKHLPWSTSTEKITAPTPFPSDPQEPSVLALLTSGDTRPEVIKEEMRKLVVGSARVIDTMESRRRKIRVQRQKLDNWAADSERKTNEMFQIAVEEKQMIKVVAAAVQRLKVLKSKREKFDSKLSEGTRKFFGTASTKKVLESKTIVEEFLRKQMDEDCKAKVYNNMLETPPNEETDEAGSETSHTDSSEPVQNNIYQLKIKQNAETLRGIEMIKEENNVLKQRLSATNEKLEWFLETSNTLVDEIAKLSRQFAKVSALNKEIAELQTQLAESREMLCAVTTDRDAMQEKLNTLECMIKEEEDYLSFENHAYESGFEDFSISNGASGVNETEQC